MKRNASQLRAIAHLSGPMMVLAGPGSGKTSVIVERTAQMISKGGVDGSSVLVVTFSRAAAAEMKERFLSYVGEERSDVTFGTFHGIFYGILKLEYHLGPGNILSEQEKFEILQELIHMHSLEQSSEGEFAEDLSREISLVKENQIPLEYYHSTSCPDEVFYQIYRGYRDRLREKHKLDFDDMLLYCCQLFKSRPEVLEKWRGKFRYILVDEFQDINPIQYEIVKMLAAPRNNLFVVGDDDQSIYHFRGASPEIMLRFPKDYPDAQTVLLDINYRCPGNVLQTAVRLIDHNKNRYRKKLHAFRERGSEVKSLTFETPAEEYRYVVQRLRLRLQKGESISDTAILLRTNQEAEGLVRMMMEYQVPFEMKEQLPNLFQHWISLDMLAYLKLGEGDYTRNHVLRIINKPNRYISRDLLTTGNVDLEKLKAAVGGKDWIEDRITTLQTHLRILKNLTPYAAINFVRKGIGYENYLEEYARYRKIRTEDLMDILDRVQESTRGMHSLHEWQESIREYTEGLQNQKYAEKEKPDGAVISTLHRVKGLEYPEVLILNVNEGSIPYRKAVLPEAIEEERRLFYVGMTRAAGTLTVCHVRKQYEKKREPSRFLKEAGL